MTDTTAEQTAETTEASEQTSTEATSTEAEATTEKVAGVESLGDKGKKALDTMKAERNAARAEAQKAREEFEAFRAKAEGREAEYKAERDADKAAREKFDQRVLKAEVRAAAAGKLSDPADALRFIDMSSFEVDDDGEVDGDAIASAITDLIEKKPYLAVQDGKRFQGDADAGTRKEARPAQLTRSDLDRMTPEQIVEARQKGQLDDLLGIKR